MGGGGGLLVYTKSGLQVFKLDSGADFYQHCKFLIRDITVYLVYRPPNSPASELEKLAELINKAEKNSVLIGDFNLPNIDWDSGTALGASRVVLDSVEDALMSQLVDFSTQVKGNILDLVLTNIPERILEVREEGRLGKSDHSMIVIEISVGPVPVQSKTGLPDWRRADWDGMRQRIREEAWQHRLKNKGAEEAWKDLTTKLKDLVKEFVPNRRMRNHNRPAWLNQDILRAIRKKKRL